MSTRYRITPNINKPLINQSMVSSFNGPPSNINGTPGISYDLTWTGTPTGTFQVQVSNSYAKGPQDEVINAGSWTTLPSSSFIGTYPVPAGAPGNGALDVVGTEFAWVRLQYTATSGTGNLVVLAASKDL